MYERDYVLYFNDRDAHEAELTVIFPVAVYKSNVVVCPFKARYLL